MMIIDYIDLFIWYYMILALTVFGQILLFETWEVNLFGKPRLCMPRDMQASSCLGQENDLTSALLEEGLLESQCPTSSLYMEDCTTHL